MKLNPDSNINSHLPHEFEPMLFMPLRCTHCYAFQSDFRHHNVPPRLKFTDEDEAFLRKIEMTPGLHER